MIDHIQKILAPVDLDNAAPFVVGEAVAFALGSGGDVDVLHVCDHSKPEQEHAEEQIQQVLESFRGLGVDLHDEVVVGDPTDTIAERSSEYDLIILAKGEPSSFFRDSVAEGVVQTAECRVLVIREPPTDADG